MMRAVFLGLAATACQSLAAEVKPADVGDLEASLEKASKSPLSAFKHKKNGPTVLPQVARFRGAMDIMDGALRSARDEEREQAARSRRAEAQHRLRAVARKAADAADRKRDDLAKQFQELLGKAHQAAQHVQEKGGNATAKVQAANESLAKLRSAAEELDKVDDDQIAELRKGARAELRQAKRNSRETTRKTDQILSRLMHEESRIGDLAVKAAMHTNVNNDDAENVAENRGDHVEQMAEDAAEKAIETAEAEVDAVHDQADELEARLKTELRRDEHQRRRKMSAAEAAVHSAAAQAAIALPTAAVDFGTAALFSAVGAWATLAGLALARRSRGGPLSEGLLVR